MKFTGTSLGERMLWKPTTLCKLWKLQSRPLDDHLMDRSGGGTILHVTPPTHPILVYAITNAAAARLVATRRRCASPRGTTPSGSPAAIPGLASRPPPCLVASSRRGSLHHGGRWIRPRRRGRPTWGGDHHGGWGGSLHRRLGDLLFSFQGVIGKTAIKKPDGGRV